MSHVRPALLLVALTGLLTAAPGGLRAEDPTPETPPAVEVKIPWVKSWGDAQAQAKREKKDLLINFTGSDWCGWCKRLEGEVFAHAEFLDKATKEFVFVFLDFPRAPELKKEVVDPALNDKLNGDFGVEGFPTIILATAEGLPYGRTGYKEGGPEAYLANLAELRTGGEKVKALLAKGKTDLKVFQSGFEALAESGFLGYSGYAWVIDHAEAQDKDGSKGLKGIVDHERARQRSKVEEAGLEKLVAGKRSREEVPWEELHTKLKQSKDLSGMALLNYAGAVGDWLASEKRWAEAKVMFQLPLRDPELAANPRIKQSLDARLTACDEGLAAKEEPKPDEPDEPDAPKDAPKDGGGTK